MTFDLTIITDNWTLLASGAARTILLCALAIPCGILLGLVLALMRLRGGRLPAAFATGYIEAVRNIPFLIQVFLLFYVLPFYGIRMTPLFTGFIALAAYAAAYSAEIFRGAILSIPAGQVEGGQALGLRYRLILRKILLPQVLSYILPTLANLMITMIKESAILSTITVAELTYSAQGIVGRTYSPVEAYTAVALIYWGVTALTSTVMRRLEVVLQPHLHHDRSTI